MFSDITGILRDLIQLFPNAEQRAKATEAINEIEKSIIDGQNATNAAEAATGSLFIAGWRPFVGWASAIGAVYGLLLQPVFSWFALILGAPQPPVVDISVLVSILFAILGIGGLRTYEKQKGIETGSITKIFKGKQ